MIERYSSLFAGVTTAVVTPFLKNGNIDFASFESLIQRQIESGVHGIVVCGSTGEVSSLTDEEYRKLVIVAQKLLDGSNIKLIVGIGTNSTRVAVDRVRFIDLCAADAVLAVAPYYNKPSQHGLKAHFSEIANSTNLPIILYNVPGRTACDIHELTTSFLAKKHNNIVAIKDATGDLDRVMQLRSEMDDNFLKKFSIISGEDSTFVPFCAAGGCGVVSVLSNLLPKTMVSIFNSCSIGDYEKATCEYMKLYKLGKLMFCESNPVPLKYAMSYVGLIENIVRLPLLDLSETMIVSVTNAVKNLDIL